MSTNITYTETYTMTNMALEIKNNHTTPSVDLVAINNEKVLQLLPVIIYVVLSVTIGLSGNSLVLYIYSIRLKRSASRFFILFLALLDLISCAVGAGSELTDLFQPYVFRTPWSCKVLRFGLSFTIISASFTLICVAFDRYYKVCKPLMAFPVKKVKTLCIAVALLSLFLSSPALVIFGLKTTDTGYGINGTECSTADGVKGTPLPIVYYIILFLAFLILFTCFIFLYIRIGMDIWKRKKLTIGETLPKYKRSTISSNRRSTHMVHVDTLQSEDTSGPSGQTDDESRGYCDNPAISETESCTTTGHKIHSGDANGKLSPNGNLTRPTTFVFTRQRSIPGKMSIRTLRTTSIFFAVSVAFVVSFLPYLIANMLKFSKVVFHDIESVGEEVVYNFLVRSYFISNFINPFIYSALNRNFRKETKKLFRRICRKLKSCCMKT